MELVWSKKLSVGNASLDAEHQQIIKLVNEVDRAIGAKNMARFSQTLKQLEEAAREHFLNEAKIARAIDYDFNQHNIEHHYILREMQLIETELDAQHGSWSASVAEHYFQFLSTWAIDHIDEDDMKMKALLVARPYHFKPGDFSD
ncbi:MAG: hypothetical protein HOO95_03940 [Gallionella sp.]|nr:hypothetical protein [Gallionella sp.]